MTNATRISGLLFAASAIALHATPASAQQVDRIIAFGDSYADTGIAYNVLVNDPAFPAASKAQLQTVYPTKRFSGGTNYIDSLSQILDAPVINYSVGGAVAGTFPVPFRASGANNVNCGPAGLGSPNICPLGFTYEVNQALNLAPDAAYFPAGVGSFGSGDLVTVSIGGNDARYYQQNYSALPMSSFVNNSLASATTGLNQLVAAGAPTISFLAGDTGRLPEVLANPTAAGIRTAYSTAFNNGIQNVLAGYAADGVMVHYLDLNLVLDNILADPGAYGITSGSAATGFTCPTPTPAAPGCLVDSSGYLFYVDGLHLTSTGFNIVAQYVASQLQAPLLIGGASSMALDNARQFGRSMTQRMDASAPRDGDMPEGLRFNLEGDGFNARHNENSSSAAFRTSGLGVMGSIDYGFGSGMMGIAFRADRQKAHYYGDPGEAEGHALEVGVYGAFGVAGGFVQGYAGLGRDRLDTERMGVINGIEASPKGHHALAGVKGGYLLPAAGMRIGPVVGLDYAHSYLKSYSEDGDAALNLGVGSVKAKSMRGSLGLEARGDLDAGGTSFRPFLSLAAEKQFADNARTVYFNQQSSPNIVNHWRVRGESKEIYGRMKAGLAADVTASVRVDASVDTTMFRNDGNETSGNVAARIAF